MKIVFMGTPHAAAVSLERLIADGHEIAAVYTQPERPAGRGNKVSISAVKELALAHDWPIFQPTKIKTPEALNTFRNHDADAVMVVAYGRILPAGFLTAFKYGALNVHFSLLPKYRGAAPVNWAIVNGEIETGVTIIQMDEGLDTGDILLSSKTAIEAKENAVELMQRLSHLGADTLSNALFNIDGLTRTKQDDSEASFAPLMKKEDGLIDWKMSATDIERRVRGFQPFPTSYTFHKGSRLTIWNSSVVGSDGLTAEGTIIEASGDNLVAACGDETALVIHEIQPEGKRRMPTRDFLNGAKLQVGEVFSSVPAVSEALKQ
jgi:methionyl-tRNA formyltransferase